VVGVSETGIRQKWKIRTGEDRYPGGQKRIRYILRLFLSLIRQIRIIEPLIQIPGCFSLLYAIMKSIKVLKLV